MERNKGRKIYCRAEDVCKKHLKAPDMINSVYFSFYFIF